MKIAKKLLAAAIAVMLVLSFSVFAFAAGQSVDTGDVALVTDWTLAEKSGQKYVTVSVYFTEAVDLESWDLALNYDAEVFAYMAKSAGKDANAVKNFCDPDKNSFTDESNPDTGVAGEIKVAGYFKEVLWDAETFLANSGFDGDCVVDSDNFEATKFMLSVADEAKFAEGTEISITGALVFGKGEDKINKDVNATITNAEEDDDNTDVVTPSDVCTPGVGDHKDCTEAGCVADGNNNQGGNEGGNQGQVPDKGETPDKGDVPGKGEVPGKVTCFPGYGEHDECIKAVCFGKGKCTPGAAGHAKCIAAKCYKTDCIVGVKDHHSCIAAKCFGKGECHPGEAGHAKCIAAACYKTTCLVGVNDHHSCIAAKCFGKGECHPGEFGHAKCIAAACYKTTCLVGVNDHKFCIEAKCFGKGECHPGEAGHAKCIAAKCVAECTPGVGVHKHCSAKLGCVLDNYTECTIGYGEHKNCKPNGCIAGKGHGKPSHKHPNTGDSAALAAAAGVVLLAGAAFVVTKKRK